MEEVTTPRAVDISISVVSHGQIDLVACLLSDIQSNCSESAVEVILTLNIPEVVPFDLADFSFPIRIIRNTAQSGFGTNHNHAFKASTGHWFCVVNPDIRLACNPFPSLVEALHRNEAGVAAPLVWNPQSELEDSFRRFPTPLSILYKALGKTPNNSMPSIEEKYICPDWVGGMFMLFPSAVFREIRGFDEHYFLYYEDVDLCARLHLSGLQVVVCTAANVVHAARRSSHGNTRYLRWHLKSMFRYFLSVVFLRAWWLRRKVRSHK